MSRKTTGSAKSERLTLAEAISNIVAKEDALVKSVEDLKQFKAETLSKLDMAIETKKTELTELDQNYTKIKKDKQIETNQFIAEYQRNGAVDILEKTGEEPIESSKLEALESELASIRQSREEEIEKIKSEERAAAKIALNSAVKNCQLEHKAETAQLKAVSEQQQKEIKSLETTIKNMQAEIAAQRQLTKEVAEAGKQGSIQQTFGK